MTATTSLRPTKIIQPFGPDITLLLFGKQTGNHNPKSNFNEVCRRMAPFVDEHHINMVYSVWTAFTINVMDSEEFTSETQQMEVSCPNGVVNFHRTNEKTPADGLVIHPGEAAFFASADCHTILLCSLEVEELAIAHGGRGCVLDEELFKGKPPRFYPSIVDSCMDMMNPSQDYHAFITCGIGAQNFPHPVDHPTYGEQNRRRMEYILEKWGPTCFDGDPRNGYLNIPELVRQQLAGYPDRIHPDRITPDTINTYEDCDDSGERLWWSNKRETDNRTGNEKGRNAILAIYHGS